MNADSTNAPNAACDVAATRTIGLSEIAIADRPGECLVTYSLGSCLGITAWDPQLRVGGMVHCMLPLSQQDPDKAKERPGMFIDTGVTRLLELLFERGTRRNRLIIKVAGGGNMLDPRGQFKIGERNYTILRKILWKNSLMIAGESVGGNMPRTLWMAVETGRVWIRARGEDLEL